MIQGAGVVGMMGGGARAALGLVCITLVGVSRLLICIIRATRIAVYATPASLTSPA